MKRIGGLYEQVCSFDNLLAAAGRARCGKRRRLDVSAFHHYLETSVIDMSRKLSEFSYQPGKYNAFYVRDPKRRLISAAPYEDRVVHHALCNVIEPIFDRCFIHDSYANRKGKGTHAAIDRCTYFARRYPYVLKCDIRKYFPTIDHDILLALVERKIKCAGTLWLIGRIVANSNPQEEVWQYFPGDTLFTPYERKIGIPIGNLTSQFFANVYLDGFDHFVKEDLHREAYIRFADDFLVFGESSRELREVRCRLQERLDGLRLWLHPNKCQVMAVRAGIPFLGWQVFPDHRRLRRSTGVRMFRNLRELQGRYAEGRVTMARVRASIMSWIGHLMHGDATGLRRRMLGQARFGPPAKMLGAPAKMLGRASRKDAKTQRGDGNGDSWVT